MHTHAAALYFSYQNSQQLRLPVPLHPTPPRQRAPAGWACRSLARSASRQAQGQRGQHSAEKGRQHSAAATRLGGKQRSTAPATARQAARPAVLSCPAQPSPRRRWEAVTHAREARHGPRPPPAPHHHLRRRLLTARSWGTAPLIARTVPLRQAREGSAGPESGPVASPSPGAAASSSRSRFPTGEAATSAILRRTGASSAAGPSPPTDTAPKHRQNDYPSPGLQAPPVPIPACTSLGRSSLPPSSPPQCPAPGSPHLRG